MKKNKKLIVLVFLVVLTSIFSIVSLAKYTYASSRTGSISIAKWEVSTNNQNDKNVNIIAGLDEDSFTIKVISTSEVAATYSIELSNVPSDTRVKIDDDVIYKEPDASGKIVFNNVGEINTGDNTEKEHIIIFKALESEYEVTNRKIGVNVLFVQKELN